MNKDIMGDEEGEWTYAKGRRESVIDYAIEDARTREKVRSMMVEKKVKSDHHPIVVNTERKKERREGRKQKKKKTKERENWTEAERKEFQKRMKEKLVREEEWRKSRGVLRTG